MNKVKFSSLNKAVFEQIDLPDNAVIADLGCRDAGSLLGFQQAFPNKIKTDNYVMYADLCTLSSTELEKYHITFKKIPRDITKF